MQKPCIRCFMMTFFFSITPSPIQDFYFYRLLSVLGMKKMLLKLEFFRSKKMNYIVPFPSYKLFYERVNRKVIELTTSFLLLYQLLSDTLM